MTVATMIYTLDDPSGPSCVNEPFHTETTANFPMIEHSQPSEEEVEESESGQEGPFDQSFATQLLNEVTSPVQLDIDHGEHDRLSFVNPMIVTTSVNKMEPAQEEPSNWKGVRYFGICGDVC